jgi:integrase/recombinase XerD
MAWWLRIQEALALAEPDLDPRRGSLLVRHDKSGRRREIGMDAWGWEQLRPWLTSRRYLPVGPLFCVIDGPTRGHPWSSAAMRVELRRLASQAGGCDAGSHHTSYVMLMRSNSPGREYR